MERNLGLGSSKPVGGKLGPSHIISSFLALLQALALVDVSLGFAVIETALAMILEDGEISGFYNPGHLCGCTFEELGLIHKLVVICHARLLFEQFSFTGFGSEIGLAHCDYWLRWIGILDDQIAGVAG